jgi:hypothetical protein
VYLFSGPNGEWATTLPADTASRVSVWSSVCGRLQDVAAEYRSIAEREERSKAGGAERTRDRQQVRTSLPDLTPKHDRRSHRPAIHLAGIAGKNRLSPAIAVRDVRGID